MQSKLVASILLGLLLAACSGGPAATTKPGGAATSKPAATGAGGAVDCAAIKTAAEQLIAVQLLAQMRTPDTVESIKDKAIGNLDLAAFLAALQVLHALDGYPSVLGDPKEAIDFYVDAAKAAQDLFATEPLTQAAIDRYNEKIGDVGSFIGHQAAISGAIGEAGC